MKRSGPLPASPDEYVQSIGGWQRGCVGPPLTLIGILSLAALAT